MCGAMSVSKLFKNKTKEEITLRSRVKLRPIWPAVYFDRNHCKEKNPLRRERKAKKGKERGVLGGGSDWAKEIIGEKFGSIELF